MIFINRMLSGRELNYVDLEQTAIMRLRTASQLSLAYYRQPLIVTTSGGKDSSVCVALAERAGIPFEVLHNHTTADAPETVRFVRSEFRRLGLEGVSCTVSYPHYKGRRVSMWSLIPQKLLPPTRLMRYCTSILKERGGAKRFIATGVRREESANRASRGIYETITAKAGKKIVLTEDNADLRQLFPPRSMKSKRICNPIVDWTLHDVWDYIESEHIPSNPLYQCGFTRVGCIGCPMAGRATRFREFGRYPMYRGLYIRAFDRMLEERTRLGKMDGSWRAGTTGRDVFHWWLEDGVLPGQIEIDDLLQESDSDITAFVPRSA